MSLCDTFRSQAFWTWGKLSKARLIKCQLGEESITDMNLLEIRSRHPKEITVQTFTKPKEAETGADWEWWLTGNSRKWLGFRIQAKIIEFSSDKFPHLHYRNRRNKKASFQSDALIKSSLDNTVKRIPLYCLYSHWNGTSLQLSVLESILRPYTCFLSVRESFGCSLVSAFIVRRLRFCSDSNSLPSLFKFMLPWHCLVCCRGFGGQDLPERALYYWRRAILESERHASEILHVQPHDRQQYRQSKYYRNYKDIALTERPPEYVTQLLEGVISEPPDRSLRTVMIIRETE